MKRRLKTKMLLLSVVATISTLLFSCDSYERKMARYEKKATEFQATLDSNSVILKVIDSISQKVFYCIERPEEYNDGYGTPIKSIMVYDLETDESTAILPEGKRMIEDFMLCDIEYGTSKRYGDRLFFSLFSYCSRKLEEEITGVFYINIRDNSLHYIVLCDDAVFGEDDKITIHKSYYLGEDEDGWPESYSKEYILSNKVTDEAYAATRKEQKETAERLAKEWRKEAEKNRVKEWLCGNWEISGYDEWIGHYTSYVCITENKLRTGYNGQEIYNGPYEIDMENRKVIFDRHDGYYTHVDFDLRAERLVEDGRYFTKVNRLDGNSNSNSYGENSNNSGYSNNSVQFRNDYDVINYTSSHTFNNNAGNSIKINFQGMYVNGSLLTNAPRVLNFSGSSATISVSSPYTGGGAMIIQVDASRGTITDGSGDVFRMVN